MVRVPPVELVVAGHQERGRAASGAPGPPGLLPHRRQRPRESVEHDDVEAADVDAQLQRVRRRDAEELPRRELMLDGAPLLGQVAGATRAPRPEPSSSSRRRAYCATSSAPRRLRVKARVWWPERTNRVTRSAVSTFADVRAPERSSTSGRCQHARTRSDRGEPSSSICSMSNPDSADASSPGLPIVALAKQNVGDAP
jgi:hypothetical protein